MRQRWTLVCSPIHHHDPTPLLHPLLHTDLTTCIAAEHSQIMHCRFFLYERRGILGGINTDYCTKPPSASLCFLLLTPYVIIIIMNTIISNFRQVGIHQSGLLYFCFVISMQYHLWLQVLEVMSECRGPCASEEGSLWAHHTLCSVPEQARHRSETHSNLTMMPVYSCLLSSTPTQIITHN